MTRDDALLKAAQAIDTVLAHRWLNLELALFGDGVSVEDIAIITKQQRIADTRWRLQTLRALRDQLTDAGHGGRPSRDAGWRPPFVAK